MPGWLVKSSTMRRDKNDLILGSTKTDEMFNGHFKKSFFKEISWDRIFWERRRKWFNKFMPFFMRMMERVRWGRSSIPQSSFDLANSIQISRDVAAVGRKSDEKKGNSLDAKKNDFFLIFCWNFKFFEGRVRFYCKINKHWRFLK